MGYEVLMKHSGTAAGASAAVTTYQTIYDGKENPATRILAIEAFAGIPLEVRSYEIALRAFNWVGVSPDTGLALTVILSAKSAASLSTLEGALLVLDAGGLPTGTAQMYTTTPTPVAL